MVAEASCHGEVCSDRTAEMSRAPPHTHTPAVLKICGLHPEGNGKEDIEGFKQGSETIKSAFWKDNPWFGEGERVWGKGVEVSWEIMQETINQARWGMRFPGTFLAEFSIHFLKIRSLKMRQ